MNTKTAERSAGQPASESAPTAPARDNASTHLRNALQTITFVRALSTTPDHYTLTPGELQGIETRILRALAEIERDDRERKSVAREMEGRAV